MRVPQGQAGGHPSRSQDKAGSGQGSVWPRGPSQWKSWILKTRNLKKINKLDWTKFMCQVSHVTPTATATDLTPSSSPTLHSWLVCRDPKAQKNVKTQIVIKRQKKMFKGMQLRRGFFNPSLTINSTFNPLTTFILYILQEIRKKSLPATCSTFVYSVSSWYEWVTLVLIKLIFIVPLLGAKQAFGGSVTGGMAAWPHTEGFIHLSDPSCSLCREHLTPFLLVFYWNWFMVIKDEQPIVNEGKNFF